MLEVEGLDWPGDEVITADQLLLILLVILVLLADLIVLQLVRGGGQAESEDSGRLLKQHFHVLLQVIDGQFFVFLLRQGHLLLLGLGLGLRFGLATGHEGFILIHGAAILDLGVVLGEWRSTCELRELLTLTSFCSLAFFSSSCWASRSFKYSSVYSLYFLVMSLHGERVTLSGS